MGSFLFVDYENIKLTDIGSVDPMDLAVWIFVGPSQKNLPIDTTSSLLKFGQKARIVQATKSGKNSLDFHICFELGALSRERMPVGKISILSNDKGFDAIVAHANNNGLNVERVTALSQVNPKKSRSQRNGTAKKAASKSRPSVKPTAVISVSEYLSNMDGKLRPRKKGKLHSFLLNHFKKSHSLEELNAAIDRLFAEGKLSEDNEKMRYNF